MPALTSGFLLEKRYRIVTMLGQGGFGRAYLAEDLNRFNERCVLKEFKPQVQSPEAWQKAKQLFQREAAVLHRLHHPQIPRFWELLQVEINGEESLFLVQDYIEGQTYWQVLQQQGCLSEADAVQLLLDILPVLDYLHGQGVIHRDISPDNLIQQSTTGKPILIDFGGVKQISATIGAMAHQPSPTQLWKEGYTPIEQRTGHPLPCSDLYALAVTILVLLTHRTPTELYDGYQATWCWQSIIQLQPQLAAVLEKMLAPRSLDRYASAAEVLQAIQPLTLPAHSRPLSQVRTWAVGRPAVPDPPTAAIAAPTSTHTVAASRSRPQRQPPTPTQTPFQGNWLGFLLRLTGNSIWFLLKLGFVVVKWLGQSIFYLLTWLCKALVSSLLKSVMGTIWTIVILVAIVGVGLAMFFKVNLLLPPIPDWIKVTASPQRTCPEVIQRREALQIPPQELSLRVNQQFHAKYPHLQQRSLDPHSPQDEPLRQEWCKIAHQVMDEWQKTQP